MRLLLTNDDGYDAEGLAALAEAAASFGEITILAPSTQQSYVGHRVNTAMPLLLTEHAPLKFHLTGTPADCVRVALRGLHLEFDFVLSGINNGGNLGADVYTSGTVAGAREAALFGVPAIALSQFHRRPHPDDWPTSVHLARRALAEIFSRPRTPGVYWNINLPHPVADPGLPPILDSPLDPGPLDVAFTQTAAGYLYSGRYMSRSVLPEHDVDRCFSGNITITALRLSLPA